MNIGDVFIRILADDKGFSADLTTKAGKAGDKAGLTLGQRMSAGIKKGSGDLVSGIKLGAGIAAFNGLEGAVSGVVNILGDAVQAAREDEESQARLGASLKANISNWDGNTKAIEATIASRQRLGFTDEEQRKSLALLVVATHDANKALAIQATAMDLARLKGISLEEASAALIKIEGGQYRALKALGIQLPKNATATEALAAVQKAANGSAETYANTSAGKLLASQIKVSEAMEKLGYIIMPALSDATTALADGVEFLSEHMGEVVSVAGGLGVALVATKLGLVGVGVEAVLAGKGLMGLAAAEAAALGPLVLIGGVAVLAARDVQNMTDRAAAAETAYRSFGKGVTKAYVDIIHAQSDAAVASTNTADGMQDDARESGRILRQSAGKIVTSSGDAADAIFGIGKSAHDAKIDVKDAMSSIVRNIKGARKDLIDGAQGFADSIFDPLIAKGELAATKLDIAETRHSINSGKLRDRDLADAKLHLLELEKTATEQEAALAGYGDKSAAAVLRHQIAVLKSTKHLTAEQKAEILVLEAALAGLRSAYNLTTTAAQRLADVKLDNAYARAHPGAPIPRAAGGPVTAGHPYWVGERGPELIVPRMNATVVSHPASAEMAKSGGAVTNIYNTSATVLGMPKAHDPLGVARALGRFARTGQLTPEPAA